MMNKLMELVSQARTIAITGHVRPDGDCVGSCLGLYHYLRQVYPEKKVHVYLEKPSESFRLLQRIDQIDSEYLAPEEPFSLFIVMDASSIDRIGKAQPYFEQAAHRLVMDHHITNTGFGDDNLVFPDASSTCEVVYEHLERELITKDCAECLYLGIAHDTGVFRYSCTSERTMQIAGALMSKGLDTANIIDKSFYSKTYLQNRVCGYVVYQSVMLLDQQVIAAKLSYEDMQKFACTADDTSGIIDQLRITEGVEAAIFAREDAPGVFKFSMRSNGKVDVAVISSAFSGGGHRMAAGFTAEGEYEELLTQISAMIMLQL